MDFVQALRVAEAVALSAPDVMEGMNSVIRWCAEAGPHPAWDAFSTLAFTEDEDLVTRWLASFVVEAPPPDSASYVWFGLGDEGDTLYVAGYDRDPFQSVPLAEVRWGPSERLYPAGLSEILRLSKTFEDGVLADLASYALCLAYGGVLVRTALKTPTLKPLTSSRRHVFLGYDGGDFLDLSAILRPSTA